MDVTLFCTFTFDMMRLRVSNLFFVYCWLWCSFFALQAQEPHSIHISTKEGLPSSSVFQLFQDSKGFVWIASNEGITRYDGFEFVNYSSEQQSSKAGSFILEDVKGRIWYENFDGHLYYIEQGKLKFFSSAKSVGYVPFCVSEKYLFIVNNEGVNIFDIHTLKRVRHLKLTLKEVEHVQFGNGALYFISDNKLYRLNEQFELITNTFFKGKSIKSKQLFIYKDRVFVFSKYNESKQLFSFDASLNYKAEFPLQEPDLIQGCSVFSNQCWIYTSTGILIYSLDKNIVEFKDKLFEHKNVSNAMLDLQGNYWISTLNDGVFLASTLDNTTLPIQPLAPSKLLSTPQGIVFSSQKGILYNVSDDLKILTELKKETESSPINFLYYDAFQQNIIYTSKGFNFYSLKANKRIDFNSSNLALKSIVRIDHKYFGIAVSGFFGLFLDPQIQSKESSEWDHVYANNKLENQSSIAAFKINLRAKSIDYHPAKKSLVVATNEGLFLQQLDATQEIKMQGATFFGEQVFWHHNEIYALDTKGNLFEINEQRHFKHLNKVFGIPANTIKRIKKIDKELYIITQQALYCYSFETQKVQELAINLNFTSFLDIAKRNNSLYILTSDELIKIGSSKQQFRAFKPRFIINHIKVNQKKIANKQLLSLQHFENDISVNFSIIDFGNAKPNEIYYRLNNEEWMPINNGSHTLLFSSLSAGKYVLEFKIGEQKVGQSIKFEIFRPFWLRWWFVLLGSLLLLFSGFLYYKKRLNRMSVQIELLKEKVNLEQSLSKSILTAVKSQMNPHFFYNALNTIQAYIFTNDNKKANTYLAKFSKLTRNILEMSERDTITLREEFSALNLYLELEKMRFSKNFEYTIHQNEIENPDIIELPPMLIQPYVENAIKHGLLHREGMRILELHFKILPDNFLEVTINDNGIGRVRSNELNQMKKDKSRSFSTEANKKRIEILNVNSNKSIEIIDNYSDSGEAIGTTVILNIQLN